MLLLAIESSCDETSVAIVRNGKILANCVSSQIELHSPYGGVVPELAARAHLRNLLPVARQALRQANIPLEEVEAVAATRGPGLPNALMIGCRAAQAIAYALGRPFLGVHHHQAHLYSPWIGGEPPESQLDQFERNVCLVVSGGHTLLADVRALNEHRVLGSTLDDAAGECFDKVAKLFGLPYPGGPQIDRLAQRGKADQFSFPRPMLAAPNDDFSFSGLKTSVRYFLRDHPGILEDGAQLENLCASVQAAIVDVLVAKTIRAAQRLNCRRVTAAGGVSCNRALRRELESGCRRSGLRLRIAESRLCTDNAGMIGILAEAKLQAGCAATSYDAEVLPGWPLEESGEVRF